MKKTLFYVGMDEINIFLLALVLSILIRRIFTPYCVPIDILWIPLLTFVIYWFLIQLYKHQNPELADLWTKLYTIPPKSYLTEKFEDASLDILNKVSSDEILNVKKPEEKKPITMKDSLTALQNIKQAENENDEKLLQSALVIQTLNDEYRSDNMKPTKENVKTSLQEIYKEELPDTQVNDETVDFVQRVLETSLEDRLPKEKEDYARIIFEKIRTAPTPLGYITPPTSTSFSAVGPSSDPVEPTQESKEKVAVPTESVLLNMPQETPAMENPEVDPNSSERIVPVSFKKQENFEPVGLLADMVARSLPQPLAQPLGVDVYLHADDDLKSLLNPANFPNHASDRCGTVDQNFYIFGCGANGKPGVIQENVSSDMNSVAPVSSAMTFNGPLSADFKWSLDNNMNSPFMIQNRRKAYRREREIMGGNGLPQPPAKVEQFEDVSANMSRNSVPLRSQTYPRLNTKRVEERHRVPKAIYADEAGGERIINTDEWRNQFKGLLPKETEKKQNEKDMSCKACFPSGVIQTSAWTEWKPVVQVEAE